MKKEVIKGRNHPEPILGTKNQNLIIPAKQPRQKGAGKKGLGLNVVSALQELQEKHGYLPIEELRKLSQEQGMPGVDIYSVATFYNQFRLKKPAKYVVSVCRGTACHVKNSANLLDYAKELLKIDEGDSTPDGLITLEVVRCIGACAKAPAVMVNDTVYGNMTNEKLKQVIESLK